MNKRFRSFLMFLLACLMALSVIGGSCVSVQAANTSFALGQDTLPVSVSWSGTSAKPTLLFRTSEYAFLVVEAASASTVTLNANASLSVMTLNDAGTLTLTSAQANMARFTDMAPTTPGTNWHIYQFPTSAIQATGNSLTIGTETGAMTLTPFPATVTIATNINGGVQDEIATTLLQRAYASASLPQGKTDIMGTGNRTDTVYRVNGGLTPASDNLGNAFVYSIETFVMYNNRFTSIVSRLESDFFTYTFTNALTVRLREITVSKSWNQPLGDTLPVPSISLIQSVAGNRTVVKTLQQAFPPTSPAAPVSLGFWPNAVPHVTTQYDPNFLQSYTYSVEEAPLTAEGGSFYIPRIASLESDGRIDFTIVNDAAKAVDVVLDWQGGPAVKPAVYVS